MVYYYHKLVNDKPACENICAECKKGARGCVQCKRELIAKMNEFLSDIKARRKKYEEFLIKIFQKLLVIFLLNNRTREKVSLKK